MSGAGTRNSICRAILQWIADMGDHPRRGLDLFLASDQARAMDLDPELVEHAAVFMEARGLVTVRRAITDTPVHLALTVDGRDCLYQGGDVEAYVREREPGTRMEFHVQGGQGHQFGNVGEAISQTNIVQQGLGVQELVALAELLSRYADDPRVDSHDAADLRDIVQDLGDDIRDGEVEPETARRRFARARRVASRLIPAVSLELTAAIDQAAQLLS
ncbi:hypothetical protein [Streptomyces sp. LNU-CPARS28]|uniref:hypothetical protein n=1 Tax=Streptomyces sp. LNU-CPARS28 TaxID=3137371 RepID=UPI0031357DAF